MSNVSRLVEVKNLRPGDFFYTPHSYVAWRVLDTHNFDGNRHCVCVDKADSNVWELGEKSFVFSDTDDTVEAIDPVTALFNGWWDIT